MVYVGVEGENEGGTVTMTKVRSYYLTDKMGK